MRRWISGLGLALCLALALTSCSTTAKHDAPVVPQPYTRIARPSTNIVQLQIALRKFVPEHHRGPALWLVGVSHIGEPAYYHDLQQQLDAKTVVLYEGVNPSAHKHHVQEPPPHAARNSSHVDPGLQTTLAKSLGLVFQLDAIDYDHDWFLNSDLSIDDIQRLMDTNALAMSADAPPVQGQGGGSSNPTFSFLMQVMDERTFLGGLMKMGVEFLGSDPQLRMVTKLMLIETLGQMNGDLANLHGLSNDMQQLLQVLIKARNQKVIDDAKMELKKVPPYGSIAIFYGTGHMPDMEKRVVSELHYRPAEEIWLTAFSADTLQTGMSPSELQMLRNMFKWQLDQMRGK